MRLGLRERYVAVLAVVSAMTLAVAAVALFSPLDQLLRTDARETLLQTLRSELGDFRRLPAEAVRPGSERLLTATRPLRDTGDGIVGCASSVSGYRRNTLATTEGTMRNSPKPSRLEVSSPTVSAATTLTASRPPGRSSTRRRVV